MIKKCKQCGGVLTAAESNKVCESCRKKKRDKQSGVSNIVFEQPENSKKHKI